MDLNIVGNIIGNVLAKNKELPWEVSYRSFSDLTEVKVSFRRTNLIFRLIPYQQGKKFSLIVQGTNYLSGPYLRTGDVKHYFQIDLNSSTIEEITV